MTGIHLGVDRAPSGLSLEAWGFFFSCTSYRWRAPEGTCRARMCAGETITLLFSPYNAQLWFRKLVSSGYNDKLNFRSVPISDRRLGLRMILAGQRSGTASCVSNQSWAEIAWTTAWPAVFKASRARAYEGSNRYDRDQEGEDRDESVWQPKSLRR